jgi:hypothetical protein
VPPPWPRNSLVRVDEHWLATVADSQVRIGLRAAESRRLRAKSRAVEPSPLHGRRWRYGPVWPAVAVRLILGPFRDEAGAVAVFGCAGRKATPTKVLDVPIGANHYLVIAVVGGAARACHHFDASV